MYNQTVLTFQKGPPSEGPKLKRIVVQQQTYTVSSIPSISPFLCPVRVMDGISVAYSCIQLTNCPSLITALLLCDLWKTAHDKMSRQLRLKKGTGDTDKLVQKGAFEENYISEGLRAAGVRMSCFCGWVHAHVSKITDTWDMFFCNDLGVVENFHLSTCVWWYTNSHKKLRNKGRISKMHINHNAWLLETGFTCKTGHILCTSPYLKCMIWPKYSPAVPAYSVI